MTTASDHPCIGVFDSGVGGLSVLNALRSRLPSARLLYIADSAHAPYGEKPAEYVVARSMCIVEMMLERGAKLVVVACNTATALAIDALRARWPEVPFVGVEPGIKPAIALSSTGRIGIMGTPATLGSERLRRLVSNHASGAQVHLLPCPGLAALIEEGELEGVKLSLMLEPLGASLRSADVDTVVLGCTHYPLIRPAIATLLGPEITIVDTAEAVAQRASSLWKQVGTVEQESGNVGLLNLQSTGATDVLQRLSTLLGLDAQSEKVEIP